jgi:hypothetical protein
LDDPASITFRRPRCGQLFELSHRLALSGDFLAQFAAVVGLAVEGLRNRSGPSHVAKNQNFYFEIAAFIANAQHIADANIARGFRGLVVRLNSAEFTRSRRE